MISLAICAHRKRSGPAHVLAESLDAELVSVDMGELGAAANHRKCWQWIFNGDSPWGIVLEDDALPVKDFLSQAEMALRNSPSGILSFYLGRNRPPHWQDSIGQAIASGKCYIMAPELLHGVAYAIHRDLMADILVATKGKKHFNESVSDWCRKNETLVAYTSPSLCEHNWNLPTLIPNQPTRYDESAPGSVPRSFAPRGWERRAWVLGGRNNWDTDSVVVMPEPGQRIALQTAIATCEACQRRTAGTTDHCEDWADRHVVMRPDHVVSIRKDDFDADPRAKARAQSHRS